MENFETLAWLITAEFIDACYELLAERMQAETELEPLTMAASA